MTKIGIAPNSWGAPEFDLRGGSPGYAQVLSEMKEADYEGTELGDWGFFPTMPMELRKAMQDHGLLLIGAKVPIALADPETHKSGVETALKMAGLMYDAGYEDALIVLSDANGTDTERTNHAGRISPEMGLSEESWKTFASGAEKVAQAVRSSFGLRTVFQHHCAGYVETPLEVALLMELTDPALLGLCLDTGQYAFGGGDPLAALREYNSRIWHIHLRDYDPKVDWRAASEDFDYYKSVEEGVFCELGKGTLDFRSIARILKENDYEGWMVVEQYLRTGMKAPKKYALNNRNFIRDLME